MGKNSRQNCLTIFCAYLLIDRPDIFIGFDYLWEDVADLKKVYF